MFRWDMSKMVKTKHFQEIQKNKRNNRFFKDFKLTSILQLFTKCHNFGVFKAKNMLDTFSELSCQAFSNYCYETWQQRVFGTFKKWFCS